MEFMIFTAPIRLDGFNFGVQKELNMSLKSIKHPFNIRFMFKEVDPAKTRIVIDKANIILKTTGRSNSRTPNIRVYKFKRHSGNTMRQSI
jgi:hypothetical protein